MYFAGLVMPMYIFKTAFPLNSYDGWIYSFSEIKHILLKYVCNVHMQYDV